MTIHKICVHTICSTGSYILCSINLLATWKPSVTLLTYATQIQVCSYMYVDIAIHRDRPIMLIFYLLCYAAVLIKFTYYAQNYAQE